MHESYDLIVRTLKAATAADERHLPVPERVLHDFAEMGDPVTSWTEIAVLSAADRICMEDCLLSTLSLIDKQEPACDHANHEDGWMNRIVTTTGAVVQDGEPMKSCNTCGYVSVAGEPWTDPESIFGMS